MADGRYAVVRSKGTFAGMSRTRTPLVLLLGYLAVGAALIAGCGGAGTKGDAATPPATPTVLATTGPTESTAVIETATGDLVVVTRVIDGDTFVTSEGETVRVIGIDTPETKHPSKPVECYGPEASRFAEAVLSQQQVRLEGEDLDRYGRRLAHVWLQMNGTTVSYGLLALEGGYAERYRAATHRYESRYLEAETVAQSADVGLWGACP